MELSKEAQKAALNSAEEVLTSMIEDGDIEKEIADKLLSIFESLLAVGMTSYVQLFAAMCVESLDLEMFDQFEKCYLDERNKQSVKEVHAYNSVLYSTMNQIDLCGKN